MKINCVLLFYAMLFRIHLIIRYLLSISNYKNARSQRLCLIHGTEATFMYAIKAVMKDRPYSFMGISLFLPLLIGGFTLRMFERPLISSSGFDFNSLGNCFWNIIITMTTVGYGDYYPISNYGRIVGIIVCLWGVFLVSISVATLTNLLKFTLGEVKAFEILCKLKGKEELKMKAVAVLKSAHRQRIERSKDDMNVN